MPVQFSSKEAAGKLFPMLKVWGDRPGHPAVALNRPVCLVGRRGMHLSLESPTVSRTHALIINDARRVYIRDLASRNGTSVNGALVHEAELAETAVVRIGSYALRCETGFPKSPEDVPAPQAPPVELHVDGHAVAIPPGQKTVLIGRREGCEIQLVDEDASPVHAVVFELAGKHHVRDLNSENGTFVNGQPTRQAELREGDELRIGRTKIRYTHAGGNGVATGDAEVDLDALEAIDVESVEEQPAAVEMPRTLDDVLQEALAVPDAPAVEEDASLDVEIDPEDIDDQPDFGSTALESNLEQLAAGPLPRRPMGELDEPELDEIDVDAPDAPMADLEAAFVDVEPADEGIPRDEKPPVQAAAPPAVAEARDEVAPQTPTTEPAPSTAPAPSSAPASTAAPAATVEPVPPPAAQAPAKEPPDTLGPLAGDGPDALSDAAPAVAVNSDQLVDNVDASTGPIAIADDDDVLDIVLDDDDDDDDHAAAAPPEASTSPADSIAAEVLDEPAEVVDGKVVSPPPFADEPLKVEPAPPSPAPAAAPPKGVFAKADLVEPARPPGLVTGAFALPAPPTAPGAMPAPQPKLEPMDDAVLADLVTTAASHDRKRRPTRQRVRQLSRRVKELSDRIAALEALLLADRATKSEQPAEPARQPEPVQP